MEFNPENNKEMANYISEQFNVNCTEQDVDNYEKLYMYQDGEDYEKESRAMLYGINIFKEMQIG